MRDGLGYKDDQGGSILFPAVLSGNAGLFETVLATVKAKLSEDQVWLHQIYRRLGCIGLRKHYHCGESVVDQHPIFSLCS